MGIGAMELIIVGTVGVILIGLIVTIALVIVYSSRKDGE
jgi:hypothetical protein